MFCYNCGNQAADAAIFCDKCGIRLKVDESANSAFWSQPYSSVPGYNNTAYTQNTVKRANSKTWYGIVIVLLLAVIIGLVFFLVKCSSSEEERKIQLSGTYGDSLGLFEFSFRRDTVSIKTFGVYIGDAKYRIEKDTMILLDFELLGLGYVSDGETVLNFEMDDYSITLEGLRLKKK